MMSWIGRYQITLSTRFYSSFKVSVWDSSHPGLDVCSVGFQAGHQGPLKVNAENWIHWSNSVLYRGNW